MQSNALLLPLLLAEPDTLVYGFLLVNEDSAVEDGRSIQASSEAENPGVEKPYEEEKVDEPPALLKNDIFNVFASALLYFICGLYV
ncbi:hypothetical protein GQ42DRAFT_164835 [Ramicandelaber brevisporus]|nr:hypothetical protein GQ42DRAFT_164835 [Ramicandelaber brevisporus]